MGLALVEISKTGIMLVDDPERTLKALCDVKDGIITRSRYVIAYENRVGGKKSIAKGTKDTHFYTLSIFDLIKPIKNQQYVATQITFDICESLTENNERYKQILRTTILNSEKEGI